MRGHSSGDKVICPCDNLNMTHTSRIIIIYKFKCLSWWLILKSSIKLTPYTITIQKIYFLPQGLLRWIQLHRPHSFHSKISQILWPDLDNNKLQTVEIMIPQCIACFLQEVPCCIVEVGGYVIIITSALLEDIIIHFQHSRSFV